MNKLLPTIDNLEPINNSRFTFSDTPFIKNFNDLETIDKLQILTDIVKQTVLYQEYPNPDIDTKILSGDDYTSSLAFIDYVNSLKIFPNSKLIVANRKLDEQNYDSHFCVLVNDNNQFYVIDCTSDIGYGLGEAHNISNDNVIDDFKVIDDKTLLLINILRNDMYNISNNINNFSQITNYNIYKNLLLSKNFGGLLLKYYECVINSNNIPLKKIVLDELKEKYDEISQLKEVKNKQYEEIWKLKIDKVSDNKSKLKIAQYIISLNDPNKLININGKNLLLRHINPRFMWENNYNVIIIKPSSYLIGVQSSVENDMVNKNQIMTSYYSNLGINNEMQLVPMEYFHPHGMIYQLPMNGKSKIMLVREKADKLNQKKHIIRENIGQVINGHYVTWFNGERVLWDSSLNTNLIHSTDDAPEASVHLLAGYPEYQSFTRFNYPNPILRKEK